MTDYRPTDGQIEQLLKARWHAIGLSLADLAEVLDAAFQRTSQDGNGANGIDGDRRLTQIAEALSSPFDAFYDQPPCGEQDASNLASAPGSGLLQSFLGLRLLQAFHELRDHRTRQMLVHLAEQIVKRQDTPPGDTG
jgi:hypothetical protein